MSHDYVPRRRMKSRRRLVTRERTTSTVANGFGGVMGGRFAALSRFLASQLGSSSALRGA